MSADDDELHDVHSLSCAVWTSDDPCTCQPNATDERATQ